MYQFKKIGILVLIILALILFAGCSSKTSPSESDPELAFGPALQEALNAGLEQYGGMGMSAAIFVPGYQIWTGVTGVSHGDVPITIETVFHGGSTGKNFTAALILQLAEEGLLSLDDPVSRWLPEYPHVDSNITVRQLLSHTSGIFQINEHPDYFDTVFGEPGKVWAPEETLNTFVMEPYYPPGEGFHYANTNYILLGLIIEAVTGSDVETELHQRFLDPMELSRTFIVSSEPVTEPAAHGWLNLSWYTPTYDVDDGLDEYIMADQRALQSVAWMAGEIASTPSDMVRWINALYHEKIVLDQDSLNEMLDFRPVEGSPIVNGYGLGAYQTHPEPFDGIRMYGHGGNIWAYKAGNIYLPDYGISVSLMYNWDNDEAMFVLAELLQIVKTNISAEQVSR